LCVIRDPAIYPFPVLLYFDKKAENKRKGREREMCWDCM
jgi:hypothetical protein